MVNLRAREACLGLPVTTTIPKQALLVASSPQKSDRQQSRQSPCLPALRTSSSQPEEGPDAPPQLQACWGLTGDISDDCDHAQAQR